MSPRVSRRCFPITLLCGIAAACHPRVDAARSTGPTPPARTTPTVVSVGFTVTDLTATVRWFETALEAGSSGNEELAGPPLAALVGTPVSRARVAHLRIGEERVELTAYPGDGGAGRPLPGDSRSNDLWFQHMAIVVSDMDRARARLEQAGIEPVSVEPQTIPAWNRAAGGIRAFYFRIASRHVLELIWFPPGKGLARWQEAHGPLFRGVDHTAIAVADTAVSLRFYADLLGLRVAGESLNYGPEQEALSGVAGARVRITGLRGAAGPGVELLEYLAPRGGRPFPPDVRATDEMHWEVTLEVHDLAGLAHRLERAGVPRVSPGVVDVSSLGTGYARALLVRDPDGHAVRLVER